MRNETKEYKTDISLTVIKAVKCGQLTMETTLGDIQDTLKREFGVTITQKELKVYLTKLVSEGDIKFDKQYNGADDTWYVEEASSRKSSIKLSVDKIEKTGAGTKIAHIKVVIDIKHESNDFARSTWAVQCTGIGLVVKGDYNINSLKWFLDFDKKHNLDSNICDFARKVIKADDLLNSTLEVK